jgi:hypothetical protein
VSSPSSSESVLSESNSPEFLASSHACIDSSYSSRVLRHCACSSLSSASGNACMNNVMSSSSMQMAVSDPSGPALAARIILRTTSGLKHSDPSFNS